MEEITYEVVLSILKSHQKEEVEVFEFEGMDEIKNVIEGKDVTETQSEGSNSLGIPEISQLAWIPITYATLNYLLMLKRLLSKDPSQQKLEEVFYEELVKNKVEEKLAKKISRRNAKKAAQVFKAKMGLL